MEYMFINISNAYAMQKDHYENPIMYLHVEIMFLIRGMKASAYFFNLFYEEKSNKIQYEGTQCDPGNEEAELLKASFISVFITLLS